MPGSDNRDQRLYIGVDFGGTKILAALITEAGQVLARRRIATPRGCRPDEAMGAMTSVLSDLLASRGLEAKAIAAIGVGVAAVVDPDAGRIVATPNMELHGMDFARPLSAAVGVPVALGNDTNLAVLGEAWLGAGRGFASVFSMFIGTGIGGGLVLDGRLVRGCREFTGEVGHIVMQPNGPLCGCGNRGCLEAFASRTAMDRDLRQAMAAGRPTVLNELLDSDDSVIKSKVLGKALDAGDALVTEVLTAASEMIGHGCMTVRHLLDPCVIVLGGGVVEACGDFAYPIIRGIVSADQYRGAREGGELRFSALGDDAGILGAAALARMHVGRGPFDPRFAVAPAYPPLAMPDPGLVRVADKEVARDVVVNVYGRTKKPKHMDDRQPAGGVPLGPAQLKRPCKAGPEVLFVGVQNGRVELTEAGKDYLARRGIECFILPAEEAVEKYNESDRRRAAMILPRMMET